ncbi:MAG: hypothetical protein JWL83_3555 [Actinomycetia bacterium]|nr:hypothetical protein [Actinomycetes bacterium]
MSSGGGHKVRLIALVAAVIIAASGSPRASAAPAAASKPVPATVREWRLPISANTRAAIAAAAPSVPTWSRTITVGATRYRYRMVGTNPFARRKKPVTKVRTQIIPIALTFTGTGHVYDPTAADPDCLGGANAVERTLASPVFKNHSYSLAGTNLGSVQFVDAFQRATFWKFTKPSGINPDYHVKLSPSVLPTMNLSVTGTEINTPCGRMGLIDVGAFQGQLLSHLADFAAAGVNSKRFPLLLLSNVVMYEGTPSHCCILGFHGAIANPFDGGLQTLAVADYDSTQYFGGTRDIGVVTHEVGEWMDDPTGANPTPAWGHTGQVSGCQANLEVGDPLSGTAMEVTMPDGTVYHPQEMAFFSWFYGQTPSLGVNGWYSMNGTFTAPAAPCT